MTERKGREEICFTDQMKRPHGTSSPPFQPWIAMVAFAYLLASAYVSYRQADWRGVILGLSGAVACVISLRIGTRFSQPNYGAFGWVTPLMMSWLVLLVLDSVDKQTLSPTAYSTLPMLTALVFSVHAVRVAVVASSLGGLIIFIAALNHPFVDWQMLLDTLFLSCLIAAMSQFGHSILQVQSTAAEYAELALVDPLTGLGNRRAAHREFEQLQRTSANGQQDAAVILLDLDHFKQVNDSYGHDNGDLALREVARILRENVRHSDFVFRWGGEEFLVVLIGPVRADLVARIDYLRVVISEFRHEALPPLTVSAGLAMLSERLRWEEVITLADSRLYSAKERGRNRVVANTDT